MEGLVTGLDDPVPELDGGLLVLHTLRDDHELVASEPGEGVRWAEMASESLRHLQQHSVSDTMAQRVVDDLEPVEVDIQHGQNPTASTQPAQTLVQPVHEHRPVGHSGEGVCQRLPLQRQVGPPTLLDIANR